MTTTYPIEVLIPPLRATLPDIYSHYHDDLPNECVGLVWADGSTQRLINQARSPKRFSISTPQLAERLAERTEDDFLLTVYHSHPGGTTTLSWDDKRAMLHQWKNGIMVPWMVVTEEQATLWYPESTDPQTEWFRTEVGPFGD